MTGGQHAILPAGDNFVTSVTVDQEGANDLFYDPIPVDFLRIRMPDARCGKYVLFLVHDVRW